MDLHPAHTPESVHAILIYLLVHMRQIPTLVTTTRLKSKHGPNAIDGMTKHGDGIGSTPSKFLSSKERRAVGHGGGLFNVGSAGILGVGEAGLEGGVATLGQSGRGGVELVGGLGAGECTGEEGGEGGSTRFHVVEVVELVECCFGAVCGGVVG